MFPYQPILKRAYDLARQRRWLWLWGLFLSGTTAVNLWSFRLPRAGHHWRQFITDWLGKQNPDLAPWLLPALFIGLLLLLVVFSLAKAATVWSAGEFLKNPPPQKSPTLRSSFYASGKYLWPVLGLQILVTGTFFVLILIFAVPIYYLFTAEAAARAIVLLILAVVIFVPAALIFGFLHLYGPIFIVLYGRDVRAALALSFGLIMHKLRESIILSAFLIGLELIFSIAVLFSLAIFALPVALLLWFLAAQGLAAAFAILLSAAFLLGALYVIVLKAGFAVFQNIAWVMAVQEMVRAKQIPETAKAFATEMAH